MLLRDYVEAYLYWSFASDEPDAKIKKIWELHLEQEIFHLHAVAELLKKYEKKSPDEVIPGGGAFPEPLHFHDTKEYVRDVLKNQVRLTADKEEFVSIDELPKDHEFFTYQSLVNTSTRDVTSHAVIRDYIKEKKQDYRSETAPNPVKELQDRTTDNTDLGRKPGA